MIKPQHFLTSTVVAGSLVSTGMAATLWTSSTPDTSPTSRHLCSGWSFCLGGEGSRLNTSGTPDSRPMAEPEPAAFSLLMPGMTALAFRHGRTALQ